MLPWGSFNPQVLGAVPSSVVFMHFFQPSWLQPSTFAVDSRAKAHECSLTAGHSGCRLAVLPQRLRPLSLMTPLAWCIHPGDCLQIPALMMLLAWKHGLSKFSLASIPQSLGPLCSSTCILQTYLCSGLIYKTMPIDFKVSIFRQVQEVPAFNNNHMIAMWCSNWNRLKTCSKLDASVLRARHASELHWEATLDVLFHSVKTQIYRSGEEIVKQGSCFLKNNMSIPASSTRKPASLVRAGDKGSQFYVIAAGEARLGLWWFVHVGRCAVICTRL